MKRTLCVCIVLLLAGSLFSFAKGVGETPEVEEEPVQAVQEGQTRTTKYSESPMLGELVRQGKLPPVDERLPDEPLVVEPLEEIGRYGGVWKDAYVADRSGMARIDQRLREQVILLDPDDMSTPVPNLVKGWEFSDDATEMIWHLRKGLKWSDGEPCTADDWLFWYNDFMLNEELSPVTLSMFSMPSGKVGLEKIDDYTLRWVFPEPYGFFLTQVAESPERGRRYVYPKHYLMQFHPDYAPMDEIKDIMKKEQYDTWTDLFTEKALYRNNADRPTIFAWKAMNPQTDPIQYCERNAYYWKVDTEGNQLPYIDRLERVSVPNAEALLLKVLSGETYWEYLSKIGGVENLPLVTEYAEEADYRIGTIVESWSNWGTIFLNMNHKDPVIRELYNDKRFRIALSVAIDRQEINDLVFLGTGSPGQMAPSEGPPYHGEDPIYKKYTEYDPDLANQLLEEMGLTARDNQGFRLRPDGKKLLLVQNPQTNTAYAVRMSEMYKVYWAAIGVNTEVKPLDGGMVNNLYMSCDIDMHIKQYVTAGPYRLPLGGYVFPLSAGFRVGSAWGLWIASKGQEGEEPPAWVKRLEEIRITILGEKDPEKRLALFNEAMQLHVEELNPIGVINAGGTGSASSACIVSNKLGNAPDEFDSGVVCAPRWQYYIEEE